MESDSRQLNVAPTVLTASCQALSAAADQLRGQLKSLDADVSSMLSRWQGASGGSYSSAWGQWQQGADDVERGLAAMARLLGGVGAGFAQQDQAARGDLDGLRDG